MELVPYIIVFALGLAAGIWLEWKYGKQAAQVNSDVHAKLDAIKAALPTAATSASGAQSPPSAP